MELTMRAHIRLPGLQSTEQISILGLLQDNGPATQSQQTKNDDEDERDKNTSRKRKGGPTGKPRYDETKREKIRSRNTGTVVYLDKRNGQGTSKRRTILMGTTAIEHVVRGQYDWRDSDLGPTRGARRRYWHDTLDNG